MEYLNPNNTLPSFVDNFHNKFEVPVIGIDDAYYVNCDKRSSDYGKKEDKKEKDLYQNMEEKTEEVEELGSHGHLCKCGSNSEICEEFINSFSLQDILSNFELPLSSSTDEDDETPFNKKKNEDEEELNLVDFLNNTQFLNDFVNRNSIKLDKVCINADTVDHLTKNNRKKRNNIEDNHQIIYDNQRTASDNQFCNPETENEEDNQNKPLRNGDNDFIHNDGHGQVILIEKQRHFFSDDSSSESSVHIEEESQNSICANHRFKILDPTSTIPLPSFDTLKSKNLKSQFSTAGDKSSMRMKDNKNVSLNKCMEMFQKYQHFHEQTSPGHDNISSVDDDSHSTMELKINEQINEFESFTGVQNILEDVISKNNNIFSDKDKKPDPNDDVQPKSENLTMRDSLILTKNFSVLDNCVQTENHETIGKPVKESSTHYMIYTKNTKKTASKHRMNQFEEVIDSGNFWINKNTDINNQNVPIIKESLTSENPSLLQNSNRDNFKVPISNGIIASTNGSEGSENNIKKSVKILTKTHLLNSMQFDKNQRSFMNSPHFLLLLTQPMKFPQLEEQYCSKNLSIDTKNKLINLQNNIRSQMRNAQFSRNKYRPNMKDSESPLLFNEGSKINFNRIDPKLDNFTKQIKNTVSDMNSQLNKYENLQEFHQKVMQNIDCIEISNNGQANNEPPQTNCKELSTLINKTENFRFDQEFKILTLRTENADCINKKIKPRKVVSTSESQLEWKPVLTNIKDKINLKEVKVLHQKNYSINDNQVQHHFHHRKNREVENDVSVRRSERIRVKKYKKRIKSCLLSNDKKSKKDFVKKCVSMSLVDQILHLRRESKDVSLYEECNHGIEEIYDLKTFKSSFVQEETIDGQKIKRLRYISNISFGNQSILIKKDLMNNKSFESKDTAFLSIPESLNSKIKENTKTVELKSVCVEENKGVKESHQKISPSLKSKYPTLEALISSTSNEQKPIIRKRKRVKFDKSKYEKIKKINKEKENNIEQNKILLLNMNKNIQNKVMQNLLLVRDHNNKTHLLFTKPIENDKVKVTTGGNITTEKETLIKASENNPNYINKKIEEMIRDMVLHKNLQQNKCNEQSSAKELNNDSLLTLVDIKSTREPNVYLQNSQNVHLVNKFDSNIIFSKNIGNVLNVGENDVNLPKIQVTVTHKSTNATEILTKNKSPSNDYEFHTMTQENNVTYTENFMTDEIRVSKIKQIENCCRETSENNQFFTEKRSKDHDTNSTVDEKDNSIISPIGSNTSTDHISSKLMKELNANREYKNSEKLFESDFNQIFAANFTGQSNVTSLWQSEDIDYNIDEMIVPNNNATKNNEKVTASNQCYTHLQYPKDSDKFQNISNTQSRTYEDQIISSNIVAQAIIGKSALNIPEINGMVESLPSVSENENVFLEVLGSNSNVSNSSMTFAGRNDVQVSDNVQGQDFGTIYGSEEMCWNNLNSAEWSNSKFVENVQPTSSNDDVYVEHLDLSEEIMQKSLQEDEKILEKEKLHVCTIEDCNSVFRSQAEWEAHARMHAVQRPFGCRYCDKAFKTSCDLSKHSATHNGDRPYKCNYSSCGRHFRTHTQRQIHERCHLDSKPYSCQVCGRTFISNTHKNNHLRIHYGLKPYVCHVEGCKRKFVDLSSLKKHTKIHTQQTFFCNICNKTYKHQQSIITHYQEVHGVMVEDVSVFIRK